MRLSVCSRKKSLIYTYMFCLHCNSPIPEKRKFCSSSCSASFNNKGLNRHRTDKSYCPVCNRRKSNGLKTCSRLCAGSLRKKSKEHKNILNRIAQSKYRAKKYRTLDPTANKQKIKEIYINCPKGYEVDHILPLSKGGKHHENNLQYLTILENRKKNNRMVLPPGFEPG